MKLKVLGSSSNGNCYILSNEKESLIIEAGINVNDIKKGLNFELGKVVGCLLSHEHGDHSKAIKPLIGMGVNIFSSKGTFQALAIKSHRAHEIKHKESFNLGNFKILPLTTFHDVAESLAFLIFHPGFGKLLFVTDSYKFPYRFNDLNHVLIEANYSFDLINNSAIRDRTFMSHMEIDTTVKVLQANDLTDVNNIILLHLSDRNSDADLFKLKAMSAALHSRVEVAKPGLEIELKKEAF
jgi:phosphoribosyl 1,2-cyclic phosphodiesterase